MQQPAISVVSLRGTARARRAGLGKAEPGAGSAGRGAAQRCRLDAAAGYRFEAAIVLALTYGLRRGEVLGLHWSALDWKAGTLGVTHSVRRIKDRDTSSGHRTRLMVGELKTPKSRRTLALTQEMVAMFRQHRVRQAEAQMAAGQ